MNYSEIVQDWKNNKKVKTLWKKQSTLWTNQGEDKWLGWLDIVRSQTYRIAEFLKIQGEFKKFKTVGLLGMGGSSLCPEVLEKTFGSAIGFPNLFILDSTDPAQVKSFQKKLNLEETCFIVSSKSGSTLETNIFLEYFYTLVEKKNFIAITDPGSAMEKPPLSLKFLDVLYGIPSIGGRYSALSDFGIIPALALGVDVKKFLNQAQLMVEKCGPAMELEENPGFVLGAQIAANTIAGQDKMTLIADKEISSLPAWIEQLVAESTGKNGKGIIPIIEEELGLPENYGKDRQFIYLKFKNSSGDKKIDDKIAALKNAGFSVTIVETNDVYNLGQEFYRWEFATAVAGSILKVNPFDQPDVESSKMATRQLTTEYEKRGHLPDEKPIFETGEIKLFTDGKNLEKLNKSNPKNLGAYLRAHFSSVGVGDYVGLLAYVEMNSENENILKEMKHKIQNSTKAATCIGFGPRFLHSTGQAYKGGPNTGVFLQITAKPEVDVQIPGQKYSFGIVEAAQAVGDFQVLASRDRRLLRVHITGDVKCGLEIINENLKFIGV